DVGDRANQTRVNKSGRQLRAEALDIHRPTRYKVRHLFAELSRATGVDAVRHRFALDTLDSRVADGATVRPGELLLVTGAGVGDDTNDLRNDITSAFDDDGVTDPNIQASDLILVMERGTADGDTAD